jgi:hypothetical protein
VPAVTDGEKKVLQELRQRRQELDAREQAVMAREAVLAAAEHKLDQRLPSCKRCSNTSKRWKPLGSTVRTRAGWGL